MLRENKRIKRVLGQHAYPKCDRLSKREPHLLNLVGTFPNSQLKGQRTLEGGLDPQSLIMVQSRTLSVKYFLIIYGNTSADHV